MAIGKKAKRIKVWNPETRKNMWVVASKEYLEAQAKRAAELLKNGPALFEGFEGRSTTDREVNWTHAQHTAGKERE